MSAIYNENHGHGKITSESGTLMKINQIVHLSEDVAGPKNCWPGYKKTGTQPGTGKNKGKRVNDCEKIKQKGVAEQWEPVSGYDTIYPRAKVIKSKNGKPIGEVYQDTYGWGCFHYKADNGADGMSSKEEALEQLKDMHNEHRQQDLAEVSHTTLKSYQQKVSSDSMKHKADPTKRSPEKANRSVAGFAKAQNRSEQGVAEGVAETVSMDQAKKVLRHYGADHFKTTTNELHFYKNGRPMSVDLIFNDDATRSVNLSQLNSSTRRLKGQGVAEGLSEPTRKVFFKVIKTQGTGMPSGYRRVKTMRPLEDGGFYIELSTPGYGMDYTRHNYKNFSLKDDQGKPITGHEANNIINGEQGVAEGSLNEFAQGNGGSDNGNYLKELARAWYTMDLSVLGHVVKQGKHALDHIIDVKESVERLLQRGIHCPDGKVRKYEIGYNSDFNGVEMQSHDHYEHSDTDDNGNDIDDRTGQPWGPYDVLEFSGRELNESANPVVAESNRLMNKLHQALLQEGRVKELADDLKTLSDAEFIKKYGKAKAAIRRDMKKLDEQGVAEGIVGDIYHGAKHGIKLMTSPSYRALNKAANASHDLSYSIKMAERDDMIRKYVKRFGELPGFYANDPAMIKKFLGKGSDNITSEGVAENKLPKPYKKWAS